MIILDISCTDPSECHDKIKEKINLLIKNYLNEQPCSELKKA